MGGLLTLAFAAGMVAPVNPCGFALLPAWITHTLGDTDASTVPVRLLRALRAGLVLAVGFAGTLAAAGLVVSAGARGLIRAAPSLGLAVGILLVVLGLWMLAGRSVSVRVPRIPGRAAAGLPPTARMAAFGVGYALASLSCTFGVILAVIAQAQATYSYAGLLLVFGVYAAGSATVLLLLALATAAAGSGLTRHVARLARHGHGSPLSSCCSPAPIWPGTGTRRPPATPRSPGRGGGLTDVSAVVSSWIQTRATLIGALAAASALVVLALGVLQRRRRILRGRPMTTRDSTQ